MQPSFGATKSESPTINILGIIIDQKLNWRIHILDVATRPEDRNPAANNSLPSSPEPIPHLQGSSVMEYSSLAGSAQKHKALLHTGHSSTGTPSKTTHSTSDAQM